MVSLKEQDPALMALVQQRQPRLSKLSLPQKLSLLKKKAHVALLLVLLTGLIVLENYLADADSINKAKEAKASFAYSY
jgi:hypothetical protein